MSGPIAVGLSGGVDSAVSALLLLRQGYAVEGLHMTNWEEDEAGYCTAAEDFQDARRVADELGIPLHQVNFAAEYRERVFSHFLGEYRAGRTPNPDVLCNREVKFGVCLAYARRLGLGRLATGHYAGIGPGPVLLRGRDATKDQSYFLSQVDGDALGEAVFPLAGYEKAEVRRLAREAGLPVHAKRDSTGICFIGERPFRDFLARYLPARPGRIETPAGEDLGPHAGLLHYTIGQRRGIELGGRPGHPEAAWYVAGKDLGRNVLVVVQGRDHPALYCSTLTTAEPNWIGPRPDLPLACTVKVRYRQTDVAATVEVTASGLKVTLDEPTYAVTPGQQLVMYQGARCLGGAVIVATGATSGTGRAPAHTGTDAVARAADVPAV